MSQFTHTNEEAPENVFQVRTSDRMKEQRRDDSHLDLYVAACCCVLQRVAACCSALQRVAARCSALQRVAARCSVLQRVAAILDEREKREREREMTPILPCVNTLPGVVRKRDLSLCQRAQYLCKRAPSL